MSAVNRRSYDELYRSAPAVWTGRPNGQLVVGHQHGEGAGHGHAHEPGALYTAQDVAAALEPEEWFEVITETRDRDPAAAERTGNPVPDSVLVARRRSGTR